MPRWLTWLFIAACAASACERPAARNGPWRVVVLEPDDPPPASDLRAGLLQGLSEGGVADSDQQGWQAVRAPAAALAERARQELGAGADVVLAVTAAGLAAAIHVAPAIAFTGVADPASAGVRDPPLLARWLPWLLASSGAPVTGAYAVTDFAALLGIAAPIDATRRLGAVFVAGDADSVAFRDQLRAQARRALVSEPLDPADPGAAVRALCRQQVRTLVLLGDRSSDAALAGIVLAARTCSMIVLGTRHAHAEAGALLTMARDERGAARAAGRRAAALLRGERPQLERFERLGTARLLLNARAADQAGVGLPLSLVSRADDVIGD